MDVKRCHGEALRERARTSFRGSYKCERVNAEACTVSEDERADERKTSFNFYNELGIVTKLLKFGTITTT